MTASSRRARFLRHGASVALLLGVAAGVACYSTGDGTAPPAEDFYYPVGLAVSRGGNVLYAINSDFDLQWNGGTVQSYDLNAIRADAVALMTQTWGAPLPFYPGYSYVSSCPNTPTDPPATQADGGRIPITESCAPPMNSHAYWRNTVVVGAFATDLQLAKSPHNLGDRLFAPIRGDATLSWIDVDSDIPQDLPPGQPIPIPTSSDPNQYTPFLLRCDAAANGGRCGATHQAGTLNDPGNTRGLSMPGEPFAMAFSDDLQSIVITHQTTQQTSLYLSGMEQGRDEHGYLENTNPSIQFILAGVANGGIGVASVPHDPAAIPANQLPPRPSFLQTSNSVAEVDLLRYYSDTGFPSASNPAQFDAGVVVWGNDGGIFDAGAIEDGGTIESEDAAVAANASSTLRPFLIKERVYPVAVNASGTNSRGIAIDPSPRLACEAALGPMIAPTDPQYVACAQLPAPVYIANRTPSSVLVGEVGGTSTTGDPVYDPDLLSLYANPVVTAGASNVYLAPIIDSSGRYAMRLFVVAFDTSTIFVYDPATATIENIINVGPGPFAMAFDPFDMNDVATHALAKQDPRNAQNLAAKRWTRPVDLKSYRFAYVTSFTDSYMQVIDLDQSFRDPAVPAGSTFENIVYTVGVPTMPIGSSSSQ